MAVPRYPSGECFWLYCYQRLVAELDGAVTPRQGPPPVAPQLAARLRELSASVDWTMLPYHERSLACVQSLLDRGVEDSFASTRDSASGCSQEPEGGRAGSVSWDPPLPLLGAGGQDEAWAQSQHDPAAALSPTSLQRVRGHRSQPKPAALHARAERPVFLYQPVLFVHGPPRPPARQARGGAGGSHVVLVRGPAPAEQGEPRPLPRGGA
eukprot:g40817.t1